MGGAKPEPLVRIARTIRSLLRRLAWTLRAMERGSIRGYIGVCIAPPSGGDVLFFAESLSRDTSKQTSEYDYTLPRDSEFVRLILEKGPEMRIYTLPKKENNPVIMAAVVKPIREEFGRGPKQVLVLRVPLGLKGEFFYAILDEKYGEQIGRTQHLWSPIAFLLQQVVGWAFVLSSLSVEGPNDQLDEIRRDLLQALPEWDQAIDDLLEHFHQPTGETSGERPTRARVARRATECKLDTGESFPTIEVSAEERRLLASLAGARKVYPRQDLEGSNQAGRVLQVVVEPETGPLYHAVVKSTDRRKATKEMIGHRHLLPYSRQIGDMIAPLPRIHQVRTEKRAAVAGIEKRYVVVSPQVEGRTLHALAREQWMNQSLDRVQVFSSVMNRLRNFLAVIAKKKSVRCAPEAILLRENLHYDQPNTEAARRKNKTLNALRAIRTAKGPLLTMHGVEIVSPLWVFEHPSEVTWRHGKGVVFDCSFGHGDFHTGNILVKLDPVRLVVERVYVLDYDYVGTYRQGVDPATLEASFLVSLAKVATFRGNEGGARWEDMFEPALRHLAGETVWQAIENNRFAHDLAKVVGCIRQDALRQTNYDPHYSGCLVSAMYRVLASEYKKMKSSELKNFNPVWETAFFYMGLHLRNIVNVDTLRARL